MRSKWSFVRPIRRGIRIDATRDHVMILAARGSALQQGSMAAGRMGETCVAEDAE